MNRLIRTEFLKLRTTRVSLVAFGAGPILCTLVTIAVFSSAGHQGNEKLGPQSLVAAVGAPASIITAVALLLGVLGTAGEYRHQTITTTLLATPRRRDVVTAKLIAYALVGAAMASATVVTAVAIAVPWLHSAGVNVHVGGDVARVALGFVASTALYSGMGVTIGALVRNQTAAIAAVLIWLLAVEGLLGNVFRSARFLEWLPVAVGRSAVRLESVAGALPVWSALLVLGGYVTVFAIASNRFVTRDVT